MQAYATAVEAPTVSGKSEMAKDTAGKVRHEAMHVHTLSMCGKRVALVQWNCNIAHYIALMLFVLSEVVLTVPPCYCSLFNARQPLHLRPKSLWRSRQSQ